MQNFIQYCAKGMTKKGAYVAAGYADTKNAGDGAKKLQLRHPIIRELIEAFKGHNKKMDAIYGEGRTAENINELAKKAVKELPVLPSSSALVEKGIDVSELSAQQAESFNFYRDIYLGRIQNEKRTIKKDKDGNVTGVIEEKQSTIDQRIRARQKMDEILGIHETLASMGEITMGQITVKIVDARKDDDDADESIVASKGDYSVSKGAENNGGNE